MIQFENRKVGGLFCSEVLSALSDYLDNELPQPLRAQVDEHLAGCDNCARFGGQVGEMVAALGIRSEPLTPEVAARLQQRLQRELSSPER